MMPPLFRVLKMLHTALLVGMLFFAVLAFLIIKNGVLVPVGDASLDKILQVIAILLSGIVVFVGFRFFSKKVIGIRNTDISPKEKLSQYRTACITWWAMIEAPGLFAIACFLIVPNYAFLVLGCFHIAILAIFRPRWNNVMLLLKIDSKDFE